MLKINEIQKIEELSMNALPSIQTMFHEGWIIRMANGHTRRANSINPLYNVDGSDDLEKRIKKIAYCERILHDEKIDIVYKITSNEEMQRLDLALKDSGYRFDDLTSVQVADLTELSLQTNNRNSLMISDCLTDDWLNHVCAFNNISLENRETHQRMLKLIIPKVHYFTLKSKETNEVVACGMGVLDRGYLGLFDIVTNQNYRKQGFGLEIVSRILKWGIENGAKKAYLQVMLNNYPALKLYERLGFEEGYTYWYRIKE